MAARGAAAGVLAAALGLVLACAPKPPLLLPELAVGPKHPSHLLLISVSGLTPERYLPPPGTAADMPALAILADAGVAAEAVLPVVPATPYPTHAALVTGQRPARHGIVADQRLGDAGVRNARYWHASALRVPTLWQRVTESGRRVAALGWPSTLGAAVDALLPDMEPTRSDQTWLSVLIEGSATSGVLEAARVAGAADPASNVPGPARDRVLAAVACELLSGGRPPALLLLRLSQGARASAMQGPASDAARAAYAAVDAEIARLAECLRTAGRLDESAIVVVGDYGALPIHTAVLPNALLAERGLVDAKGWNAIARSNGGSAFVYAKTERAALRARRSLEAAAVESKAFRVVSAQEMLDAGTDTEAWFGLEARLGFAFGNTARPPLVQPAALRAAGGYLSDRAAMRTGFVGWGRGLRGGVRVPVLEQIDVAPTLAQLMGVSLGDTAGRAIVGVLGTGEVRREAER